MPRDYRLGVPPHLIRVYDDRLTLWNPVILPDGWAAERLLVDHASRPSDPGAAGVMFRAGEIVAWGPRIQRIMEACRSAGAPAPTLTFENSDMTVEFRLTLDDLEALAGKSAGPGTTQETTQGRIVAHLQANPQATRILLAQWLGRSDAGVKYHLAKLTKAGRKRRTGTTKAGRWNLLA